MNRIELEEVEKEGGTVQAHAHEHECALGQAQAQLHTSVTLNALGRSAREAGSDNELAFSLVNDSHALTPYRQSALWLAEGGVRALSGVVQLEANAPYVHWLQGLCRYVAASHADAVPVVAADLPEALGAEWAAWLPAYGLWLPLAVNRTGQASVHPEGGLLLARDIPWQAADVELLSEWAGAWGHAWRARQAGQGGLWPALKRWSRELFEGKAGQRWWQQARLRWAAVLLLSLAIPVRLTVLAPGELVPSDPAVIRAPLDGVIASFAVKPNEQVRAGQPLFSFVDAPLQSRLEVADQALLSAEAEYRQGAQLAVNEAKSKAQLAMLMGKVEERRAEADFLRGQLERARVLAPRDGIAMFDDPSEWIGKPVATGERIMRVASAGDVEIEAWLAVGDAIALEAGAPVRLYLNAIPLQPVAAQLRYVAHEAVQRPDGNYAYRVRAKLEGASDQRAGLKGTAKLSGEWVPLIYWVLRRPLAAVRQLTGW
jgi:hypothetical protein